jgi:hypothetical protein
MKNNISFFQDRSIEFSKTRAIRAWTVVSIESCFIKFNQLIADWFFVLKERRNFLQERIKSFRRKSPCHLVSLRCVSITSINEVKLSSESFRQPIEATGFRVVALKLNFISRIRSFFGKVALNAQTTFSINKSCKISQITHRGINSIFDFLKFFFNGMGNKVAKIFKIFHLNDKIISFRSFVSKFFKDIKFFSFFHKKWLNALECFKELSFKNISVYGFCIGICMTSCHYRATKYCLEPMHVFNMSRVNNYIASWTDSSFSVNFAYIETPVSIEITSSISKIGVFNHIQNDIWLGYLSLQVTDMNPTNLGISDFSLVATTLSTNNAYKFTSGIEGEDRFGTGPIRSAFFMLSSTELQTDFDSLVGSGYISAWNYPNTANALPSEVGSVFNIRILTSSEAPVARNASANNQDVYYNTVLGKQALTHIGQDGYSMELLYRDRLYSGYLGQNVTLGVSFAQAQAITQDTAIRNLLCTSLYSSQIV